MSMNRKTNIELSKDGKSSMYILTKIDSEGFHHSIFVSKEELVEISKLINNVIQKITIENCTASINCINDVLKQFPFIAYVVRTKEDERVKKTIIYIHLKNDVRFDTIETIQTVINEVITCCQKIDETLRNQQALINALIKDCKPFIDEKEKPNLPTTKKVSD